ncbi:hypothetical protein [Pedobacter duraquae]|uniref:Lipoprotein n=1 Tax=Pedobacter duraquae TaxID=425511 RepID=A0A4R6IEK3_9SPHI|nr:hypothetical protein [Pedobacter duraquae]TDO20176.1 hypothetical protein CLV32_3936 [Pedobacter duraquae]
MKAFKKTIYSLVALLLIGTGILPACQQSDKTQSSQITDSNTKHIDTATKPGVDLKQPFTAEGIVKATVPGKDGYMATLTGKDGKTYIITMSIMRLEKAYTQLNVGDPVKVFGDTVHLNDQINILVEKFELKK